MTGCFAVLTGGHVSETSRTERVVSYLTEELVRLGHDVSLFASGDSVTSARLVSCATTAPECDDLQRATEIAMEMVTRFGMDEKVGQCTYAPPQTVPPVLAAQQVQAAEATAREIDVAVRGPARQGIRSRARNPADATT